MEKLKLEHVQVSQSHKAQMSEDYLFVYSADSEENAIINDDYPWGYKFRTERKYWIERKPRYGSRLCYRTLNPKNGKWCAVKKSTYSDYLILAIDLETEHVKTSGVSIGWGEIPAIKEWITKHEKYLPENDVSSLKFLIEGREKFSENFDKKIKEHKEELKTRSKLEMLNGVLYKEREVITSSEDLDMYKVQVRVEGVKKKCRKQDTEFLNLGFMNQSVEAVFIMRGETTGARINEAAIAAIDTNMRKVKRAWIEIKKVTFMAPKGESTLHGMREMLMTIDHREEITHLIGKCKNVEVMEA